METRAASATKGTSYFGFLECMISLATLPPIVSEGQRTVAPFKSVDEARFHVLIGVPIFLYARQTNQNFDLQILDVLGQRFDPIIYMGGHSLLKFTPANIGSARNIMIIVDSERPAYSDYIDGSCPANLVQESRIIDFSTKIYPPSKACRHFHRSPIELDCRHLILPHLAASIAIERGHQVNVVLYSQHRCLSGRPSTS